jgi:hypothetical protein
MLTPDLLGQIIRVLKDLAPGIALALSGLVLELNIFTLDGSDGLGDLRRS